MRTAAALLVTAAGVTQMAAMWVRPLDAAAVTDMLLGAIYLIIGIGLFGQSRFTLYMAIAVPAVAVVLQLARNPFATSYWPLLRVLLDLAIIVCSARVLWRTQGHPSS